MTVLKDAASAALYGSRGANGVIIITTKQGDQNTKATVKVKASLGGSNRAVRDYDRVSTDQYFELYWEALRNQYAKSADYTPATAAAQASKDLVTKLMGRWTESIRSPICATGRYRWKIGGRCPSIMEFRLE